MASNVMQCTGVAAPRRGPVGISLTYSGFRPAFAMESSLRGSKVRGWRLREEVVSSVKTAAISNSVAFPVGRCRGLWSSSGPCHARRTLLYLWNPPGGHQRAESRLWALNQENVAEVDVPYDEPAKAAAVEGKSMLQRVWPYIQLARLNQPIGIWFFVFLSFWTVSLATPVGALPDPKLLAWFTLFGIVSRSAVCSINDIVDADLDAQVERSKTRPLPSGAITKAQAIGFYVFQVGLLGAILLQLNGMTTVLAALTVPLWALYPVMKRVTFWPQGYLGLCIAWPLLAGWTSVRGSLDQPAVFLPAFIASAFWIILADTMYAHADKKDDAKAGVKSTALLFGDNTKVWLCAFYAVCASGLAFTGVNSGLGWPFYAGTAVALAHLAWTVSAVNLDSPKDCLDKFFSTSYVFSPVVFLAVTLGKLA